MGTHIALIAIPEIMIVLIVLGCIRGSYGQCGSTNRPQRSLPWVRRGVMYSMIHIIWSGGTLKSGSV